MYIRYEPYYHHKGRFYIYIRKQEKNEEFSKNLFFIFSNFVCGSGPIVVLGQVRGELKDLWNYSLEDSSPTTPSEEAWHMTDRVSKQEKEQEREWLRYAESIISEKGAYPHYILKKIFIRDWKIYRNWKLIHSLVAIVVVTYNILKALASKLYIR